MLHSKRMMRKFLKLSPFSRSPRSKKLPRNRKKDPRLKAKTESPNPADNTPMETTDSTKLMMLPEPDPAEAVEPSEEEEVKAEETEEIETAEEAEEAEVTEETTSPEETTMRKVEEAEEEATSRMLRVKKEAEAAEEEEAEEEVNTSSDPRPTKEVRKLSKRELTARRTMTKPTMTKSTEATKTIVMCTTEEVALAEESSTKRRKVLARVTGAKPKTMSRKMLKEKPRPRARNKRPNFPEDANKSEKKVSRLRKTSSTSLLRLSMTT